MLKGREFLACLIALLMEIFTRRQEWRHIGPRRTRPPGRRHGLLPAEEFIVNISTELLKLSCRQPEQLVSGFVRFTVRSFIPIRCIKKSSQGKVVLTKNFLDLFCSLAAILGQSSTARPGRD
jgi:hypothetical protein